MSESLGISIQSTCYMCQALDELCFICQEAQEARDAEIAHQIVDDSSDYFISTFRGTVLKAVPNKSVANGGSVAEPRPLSVADDAESGHDWIGSVTKLRRPAILPDGSIVEERYEFLDPIALIADRLYDLETSITLTPAEVICQDCHLVFNKWSICPNCN